MSNENKQIENEARFIAKVMAMMRKYDPSLRALDGAMAVTLVSSTDFPSIRATIEYATAKDPKTTHHECISSYMGQEDLGPAAREANSISRHGYNDWGTTQKLLHDVFLRILQHAAEDFSDSKRV